MSRRKIALMLVVGGLAALPAAPAQATNCSLLSVHCADSWGLVGHTHSCVTSGTNRVCFVHWHGNGTCSGTTSGTCTVVLNAGADGYTSGSCNYSAGGNCTVSLSTAGRSWTFPAGTSRQSCASLTTTANGGLVGTASESESYCFWYS